MVLRAIFSPVVNDQLQQSHISNLKAIFPPCKTYVIEYLAPQKRPYMGGVSLLFEMTVVSLSKKKTLTYLKYLQLQQFLKLSQIVTI